MSNIMKPINVATMTPKYEITAENARLSVVKGNSKIGKGIYAFSTLPGNEEHLLFITDKLTGEKQLLTDIPGTCSGHCEKCFNGGCYAVNSAKLHHNVVINAWAGNTILLRSGKLFTELDEFLTKKNAKYYKTKNVEDQKVKTFRINVSGEIQDAAELKSWNDLAVKHPEIMFGVYTKNYEAVGEFIEAQPDKDTAPNFVINISQWHGEADAFLAKYPGKFNVFEYDDSNRKNCDLSDAEKERLSHCKHCKAVTIEGKHAVNAKGEPITCDGCTRCYQKQGWHTAVYAH